VVHSEKKCWTLFMYWMTGNKKPQARCTKHGPGVGLGQLGVMTIALSAFALMLFFNSRFYCYVGKGIANHRYQ